MNAVNLMPAGSRRSRLAVSTSRPFLALVGGLVAILVATAVVVSLHDTVSSRRAELSRLTAATMRWSAAAQTYDRTVEGLSVRAKSIDRVRQLIADRYDWSVLLAQLAGRMPTDAALASITAAAPKGPGAAATGISISACARSQDAVAATMVALRKVTGVSRVVLSTSGKGAAAGTGAETCALPIQFQITLSFGPQASSEASPASQGPVAATEAASTGAPQ